MRFSVQVLYKNTGISEIYDSYDFISFVETLKEIFENLEYLGLLEGVEVREIVRQLSLGVLKRLTTIFENEHIYIHCISINQ